MTGFVRSRERGTSLLQQRRVRGEAIAGGAGGVDPQARGRVPQVGLARDAAGDLLDGSVRIAIDTSHPELNVRCVDIRTSGAVSVSTPPTNGAGC